MTTLDITAGAIISDICAQDEQIIRRHALNLGKKEQSQVSRYLKLRKQLLKQKGREGKLISEAEGDRRDYYKAARAALLMQKYISGKPKKSIVIDGTVAASKFLISPIATGLGTIAHTITAATTATASVLTGGASERTRRNSNADTTPPQIKDGASAPLQRHASADSIESSNNNNSGSKTPVERKLTKSASARKGSSDSLDVVVPQSSTSLPEVSLSPIRATTNGVVDAYAFQGMLTVFQEHSEPVTIVRFANEDKSLLAFASQDAKISICQILPTSKLIRALEGHLEAITDFRWSMTNDIMISSSLDKTVKVWAIRNGECIRTVEEKAPCTAVCFHPLNNNHFVYGTAKGTMQVVNVSTGKILQKVVLYQNKAQQFQPFKVPITQAPNVSVNAIEFDATGNLLFVGDSKGAIHTYLNDAQTGIIQFVGRTQASSRAITAIEFHSMRIKTQTIPTLLVNCCDSSIKLFKINPKPTPQSQLTLDKQLPIVNMQHPIRSHFCPLLSNRDGVCIVSGSEDGLVYIFDVTKEQHQAVNQLQGHSGIVYDAAWNYDETVLATCDAKGTVICWKRVKEVVEQ